MCTFSEATSNVADGLRQNAPVIGIIFGIGALIASGVAAAVASRKADDILDDHKELLEEIKEAKEEGAIEEKVASKEIARCYGQTAWKLFRRFAPAIGLAVVGSALIIAAYKCEHTRMLEEHDKYLGASAALSAALADFKGYRERVVDRFGEEIDNELLYDIKKEEVEEKITDEKGKEKTVKKEVLNAENAGKAGCGYYAKWFKKDTSAEWVNSAEMNKVTVEMAELEANQRLEIKGMLTVNDVHDILRMLDEYGQPLRTKAGQIMGWVYDPEKAHQIEFGLENPINEDASNGKSTDWLITLNPEGPVYELMAEK